MVGLSQYGSGQLEGYVYDFQLTREAIQIARCPASQTLTTSLQSFNKIPETAGTPIHSILTEFQSVFSEPAFLPLFRTHNHVISLLPNSKPPNIRLYRYPHSQKTEIENQVAALMKSGFIQPS